MIHIRENGGEIMKYGMRKPSIKRSVKARTTSRVKRSVKKSVNFRKSDHKTDLPFIEQVKTL